MTTVFAGLTFSSPWMLGFLVAVALPWWLAWRATPLPKRVALATTSLVIAAARRDQPWRQLSHWLLPVLRSLILVAIAVAAAEPAWQGSQTATMGPTRRVLLLDHTAANTNTAPVMAAIEALADLDGDERIVLEQMSAASASPQQIPLDTALVILADGAVPPPRLRTWLGAWVKGGGGVLALLGPQSIASPDQAMVSWLADLAGIQIADQREGSAEGIRRPSAGDGSKAFHGPTVQRYVHLTILPNSPSSTVVLADPQTFLETMSSEPLLLSRGVGQGQVAISALPWTVPESATLSDAARWSDLPAWPVFATVVEDLLATFTPSWDHLAPPPSTAGSLWLATHDLARLCLVVALALCGLELIVRRSLMRPHKRPERDWRCGAIQVTALALLTLMLIGVRHAPPTSEPSDAPLLPSETLTLNDLVMPTVAWIGDKVEVEVIATRRASRASPAAEPVVELIDPLGRVISQATLAPAFKASDADYETWRALLPWSPDESGLQRFTARLAASDAATATTTRGHTLPAVCGVAKAPRRVLIIDGTARWETRHLARTLRSTPGVEVQVSLLEADSTAPIPTTPDAVAAFTTVVLGAFDPRDLPSGAAEVIATAAQEQSVGIVWTLDGRCDLASLVASPLGAILPCVPMDPVPSWPDDQRLRVVPTVAAAGFPWMAPLLRAADRAGSEVSFPALTRARQGTAIAPLLFASPPAPSLPNATPAMLVDHTPTGRVLATLGETWRWRGGGSSDEVDAFWRSAVQFVAEPHLSRQLGEPLKEALRDAERQRLARRTAVGPDPAHAVSLKRPHSSKPLRNHPVLIAIVILSLATSWRLCRSE